jgi:hypothetical protein
MKFNAKNGRDRRYGYDQPNRRLKTPFEISLDVEEIVHDAHQLTIKNLLV